MLRLQQQSTDATPIVLWTYPLANNEGLTASVVVGATQSDGSKAMGGRATAIWRKPGAGAPVLVSSTDGDFVGSNEWTPASSRPKLTFDVSGNDCRIVWTGKAATTINVRAQVRFDRNA